MGLYGGIDSSLTAAVADDALGAGNPHRRLMPSGTPAGRASTGGRAGGRLGIHTVTLRYRRKVMLQDDSTRVAARSRSTPRRTSSPGSGGEPADGALEQTAGLCVERQQIELRPDYATSTADWPAVRVLKDVPKTWSTTSAGCAPGLRGDNAGGDRTAPDRELRADQMNRTPAALRDSRPTCRPTSRETEPRGDSRDGFTADVVQRVVEMVTEPSTSAGRNAGGPDHSPRFWPMTQPSHHQQVRQFSRCCVQINSGSFLEEEG